MYGIFGAGRIAARFAPNSHDHPELGRRSGFGINQWSWDHFLCDLRTRTLYAGDLPISDDCAEHRVIFTWIDTIEKPSVLYWP